MLLDRFGLATMPNPLSAVDENRSDSLYSRPHSGDRSAHAMKFLKLMLAFLMGFLIAGGITQILINANTTVGIIEILLGLVFLVTLLLWISKEY